MLELGFTKYVWQSFIWRTAKSLLIRWLNRYRCLKIISICQSVALGITDTGRNMHTVWERTFTIHSTSFDIEAIIQSWISVCKWLVFCCLGHTSDICRKKCQIGVTVGADFLVSNSYALDKWMSQITHHLRTRLQVLAQHCVRWLRSVKMSR